MGNGKNENRCKCILKISTAVKTISFLWVLNCPKVYKGEKHALFYYYANFYYCFLAFISALIVVHFATHCTETKQIVCAKIPLLCNPPCCLEVRDFQKKCSKIWSVLQWPLPVENKIRNCLSSVAMLCTFPASSIFPNPGC